MTLEHASALPSGLPQSPVTEPHAAAEVNLPRFADELYELPYGLGMIQTWIINLMTRPEPAAASIIALICLYHFAMSRVRIDSLDGLGMNEYFMFLAPTCFGKEALRKAICELHGKLASRRSAMPTAWQPPKLELNAPGSMQALHRSLEESPATTLAADEFGEWIFGIRKAGFRQQVMGYLMELYTKAFSWANAPAVADRANTYRVVEHPHVSLVATSTPERILETLTGGQADAGMLNRFVFVPLGDRHIPRNYKLRADAYVAPDAIMELISWVCSLDKVLVQIDDEARDFFETHDSLVIEPFVEKDKRLAGRISEQALKLACAIALSDQRLTITKSDLRTAFAIRESLYHRTVALFSGDGTLRDMHPTSRALEQVKSALRRHGTIYVSQLCSHSRQYEKLSVKDRESVVRAAVDMGYARRDNKKLIACEPAGS